MIDDNDSMPKEDVIAQINTDNIPEELKNRSQWVNWKLEERDAKKTLEERDAKKTKVPYNPGGRKAKVTDPSTFSTFAAVVSAYQKRKFDGIGFVLCGDDPFTGIDLDGCRNPEIGALESWAAAIVSQLDSYTEISPSGTGVRIFVRAKLPADCRKRTGKIEVYGDKRFLTITGNILDGRNEIRDRSEELPRWHAEVFTPKPPRPDASESTTSARLDGSILQKAFGAKNGNRIRALYYGDGGDYESPSEADAALLSHLAFYTDDREQLDRLFRGSKLMRPKWEDADYRNRTLDFVLSGSAEAGTCRAGRAQNGGATGPAEAHQGKRLRLRTIADVEPEAIEWLWDPRIAIGKLTILAGDPGDGKSTLAIAVAAAVTNGTALPCDKAPKNPGSVLLLAYEDGLADTIRPRCDAAGVDLQRLHVIEGTDDGRGNLSPFSPEDLPQLEDVLKGNQSIKLIIIDPLMSLVGGKTDTHRDNQVRASLTPLVQLAERHHVAVVAVMHLNKSDALKATYRVAGSGGGFVGLARSVLLVAKDAETGRRGIVQIKNNIGPMADTIEFEIGERGFLWCGVATDLDADRLLGTKKATELEGALSFLRDELADGPVLANVVKGRAQAEGISEATLRRAAEQPCIVKSKQHTRNGQWLWSLKTIDEHDEHVEHVHQHERHAEGVQDAQGVQGDLFDG